MDTFSPEKRSDIMRRVRSTDTTPEKKVRSLLHKLGFRFRLHRSDLPGSRTSSFLNTAPSFLCTDVFGTGIRAVPMQQPASRQEYWLPKFKRTVERDKKNQEELRQKGWNVIVVWECETKDIAKLAEYLLKFFDRNKSFAWFEQVSSAQMAAEQREEYLP